MTALAALHVAKRDLGLDDDTYRDLLERETGKRSAKDMTSAELDKVLAVMRRSGAPGRSKSPRRALEGPYAKKLQALWISGWNLGVVRDRRDEALLKWVEGQTGIARTEWLRDPAKGSASVDALKAWIAREAGVSWTGGTAPFGERVARAQVAMLVPGASGPRFWAEVSGVLRRPILGERPSAAEWIKVINDFGQRIRALPSRKG